MHDEIFPDQGGAGNLKIIHQQPLEVGGHTVTTELPNDYIGPCAVFESNFNNVFICAFNSLHEAASAAIYATTPDGGYGSTLIEPCSADMITHADFEEWLL